MKSISTINQAIMENTKCLIVEVHASFINLKVGVSLDHDVSLRFISLLALRTCWVIFQAKNNTRSTLANSTLILVSHQSLNARTANRHLCSSRERNGAQRRTKVSFGRTMMQAWDEATLSSEKVNPVA